MAPVDRLTRISSQLPQWTDQLLDLSFKNTLLNFRLTKTTLDLGAADEGAVSDLLAGRQVRLAALFPKEEALAPARVQARNLARRIRLYDEEKGVDVGYLTLGVVGWRVDHAGVPRHYRAPSVLSHLMLRPRGAAQEEFDLKLVDEPVPNSVLFHVLRQQVSAPKRWPWKHMSG